MIRIFILVILIPHLSLAGFELKFDSKNLDLNQAQIELVSQVINEVKLLLPNTIIETLNRTIWIAFDINKLSPNDLADCNKSKPYLQSKVKIKPKSHSKYPFWTNLKKINRISIDKIYLKQMLSGRENTTQFNCRHLDGITAAKGAILHEIAHLYDYMEVKPEEEQGLVKKCTNLPEDLKRDHLDCQFLEKNPYSVSGSLSFLNQQGWSLKGLIFRSRENLNQGIENSPDALEFQNPQESFAVNFEYFLLDNEFECRKPSTYLEFSRILKHTPIFSKKCTLNLSVTYSYLNHKNQSEIGLAMLDPDQIYQIDYLFASESEQVSSQWGHAMFRIISCKPGREVGPDCRRDIAYHTVFSFRALVDDIKIDTRKGLNGNYPSKLLVLPMVQITREYNQVELRNLISLPLKLTTEEKKRFVYKALELYWNYNGAYYFLSNNCATEAMNLLYSTKKEYDFQNKFVIHPLDLYNEMQKMELIDTSLLQNQKKSTKEDYTFFAAETKQLNKSFHQLENLFPKDFKNKFVSLNDYLFKSSAAQRSDLKNLLENNSIEKIDKRKAALSLFSLEEQIYIIFEQRFQKLVVDRLTRFTSEKNPKFNSALTDLKELIKHLEGVSPVRQNNYTYGIPNPEELTPITNEKLEEVNLKIKTLKEKQKEWINVEFKNELSELNRIIENVRYFAQKLQEYSKQ